MPCVYISEFNLYKNNILVMQLVMQIIHKDMTIENSISG